MSVPSINLDDRRFADLMDEAKREIARRCPEWTDLSPGDPGSVLLEAFAHLTEIMIYRLNRLPEKAYVEFVRLLGVKVAPPSAAQTRVVFSLAEPLPQGLKIPRDTRVSASRADGEQAPVVFVTLDSCTIAAGATTVEVGVAHCEPIDGELAGIGTGVAGLTVATRRAPIIAPLGNGLELVVGVEAGADELTTGMPARLFGDRTFRIWQEVESFAGVGTDDCVYLVDRASGKITFAPAIRQLEASVEPDLPQALAAIPAAGREIRLWYRTGGGVDGNIAAGTLTTLKDAIAGASLEVSNPQRAIGGKAIEALENTLARAPLELHSLRRAVTARDFELVAIQHSGGVNRAYAYTKAEYWQYAQQGTVELILVPELTAAALAEQAVTPALLHEHETDVARDQVLRALEERKPLGTRCTVEWCQYKSVKVVVTVRIRREEDAATVQARILNRLNNTINPLSGAGNNNDGKSNDGKSRGWPFGRSLSTYHVYQILSAEPGVVDVEPVVLRVDAVPDEQVFALRTDALQAGIWYAGSADRLFRSINDGAGWELMAQFPGSQVKLIASFGREAAVNPQPGAIAVVGQLPGAGQGSVLHLSADCGTTWHAHIRTQFRIHDIAWIDRDGVSTLLLATDVGLYEVTNEPDAVPVQILVKADQQALGFYAISTSADLRGETTVALAARSRGGVFLSSDGGRANSFDHIGLSNEMIQLLRVQHVGPRRYLWAGYQAAGDDKGKGAAVWEIRGGSESPAGWRLFDLSWDAGGCLDLAFAGSSVVAASSRRGVLTLDPAAQNPTWQGPEVGCGLPMREFRHDRGSSNVMRPVDCVGAVHAPDGSLLLLAGGADGIFASRDGGLSYERASVQDFTSEVTLPPDWLFCSSEHDIRIVSDEG